MFARYRTVEIPTEPIGSLFLTKEKLPIGSGKFGDEAYRIDASRIRVRSTEVEGEQVTVTIPTGLKRGYHPVYVDVVVDRLNLQVVKMSEYWLP